MLAQFKKTLQLCLVETNTIDMQKNKIYTSNIPAPEGNGFPEKIPWEKCT